MNNSNISKKISSNIARYKIAQEFCDKLIRENQGNGDVIDERQENIFNLKVYKNSIVPFIKDLEINLSRKGLLEQTENKSNDELIGSYEIIIDLLEKFIRPKRDAEYYYKQGIELYNSGEHKQAITAYDKAIKLNPDYYQAHNKKGSILASLSKYMEAIRCYNKARLLTL